MAVLPLPVLGNQGDEHSLGQRASQAPQILVLPELKLAEPGANGTVHTHHQGDPQQEADAAHHEAQRLKEEPGGTTDAIRYHATHTPSRLFFLTVRDW